jgi:hypothetical protein
VAGRRFLNAKRPIYSAALKANMPIFEAAAHFIESAGAFPGHTSAYGGDRTAESEANLDPPS